MKGIEQIELDNFIVKLGFRRQKFLNKYILKLSERQVNINLDVETKKITYSTNNSLVIFKNNGTRFFNDESELKKLLTLITKAIKWKK